MGRAERANPMSWRNRTPEQRVEGLQARANREGRKVLDKMNLQRLIADYRKRRAAAQGAIGK
jgi:hypothetical protein